MKQSLFLSYSHKDDVWKDLIVEQLAKQFHRKRINIWHDRLIAPGSEWFVQIEDALNNASVAVCLISKNYLTSTFCSQYEVAPLLERRERYGLLLVPVLLDGCAWDSVHWLKQIQMLPRDGKTLATDYKGREELVIDELVQRVEKAFINPTYAPPPRKPKAKGSVDIARLPYTGYELVGRDTELARLLLAWRGFDTNLVCLTGWGGVGKSTLVNKWLESLEADGFNGASDVLGWSFTSDETTREAGSSDLFLQSALKWFGDENPARGSPWDKGERLASLVAERRTLLVLDGIEPLQSRAGLQRGRITDPGLATFLTELARVNRGLCVVTSREPLTELQTFKGTVLHESLEQLSDEAGRAVLRLNGVRGPDQVLEAASRAVGGHALALRLLAINLRGLLPEKIKSVLGSLVGPNVGSDAAVQCLLARAEAALGDSAPLELLHVLALFGGSVAMATVHNVLGGEPIAGVNAHTQSLSDGDWSNVLRDLRKRALLAPENDDAPNQLEVHPMISIYFAQRMRSSAAGEWAEANNRLSQYYAAKTRRIPQSMAEAEPALKAVGHRAESGDLGGALHYFYQVLDGGKHFWVNRLGAPNDVLSILIALFVAETWKPRPDVPAGILGYLFNITGTALRALGRLEDAVDLYTEALAVRKSEYAWQSASKNASNLAECMLQLGRIQEAVNTASESVKLAGRSDDDGQPDIGQQIYCRTTLADALHQAGEFETARRLFEEAEALHVEHVAGRGHPMPVLYRLPGIRYGEFLLSTGRADLLLPRLKYLDHAREDISDEENAYGRVLTAETMRIALTDTGAASDKACLDIADAALTRLQTVSSEVYLPRGFLVRARIKEFFGDNEGARKDVERARVVAERNGAALLAIDSLLESGRIEMETGNRDLAREILAKAEAQARTLGYQRRMHEFKTLRARL